MNAQNQKHGIGTSLFENGFCYQGMYENDQITGMGISLDPNLIKYMGEHRNGKRHGCGILFLPDGREYEGKWRENRMHGKGHERLPNGQSYMVFTNNGTRMDFLNEGKVTTGNVKSNYDMPAAQGQKDRGGGGFDTRQSGVHSEGYRGKGRPIAAQSTNNSSSAMGQYYDEDQMANMDSAGNYMDSN